MPLNPQPLPLPFQGGVQTKQDGKQVPATQLLRLENATFTKQTTLSKRNGYEALSRLLQGDASSYETPIGMAKRGDELLVLTPDRALSYRPDADRWVDTGQVATCTLVEPPIARTGTAQTTPDHATKSGVTAVAWEDSRGGVYCSVVEAGTGRILVPDVSLDEDGISPRCVPCGTVLHIYWARASVNRIYVAIVNPALPLTTPTGTILVGDLSSTNPAYDVVDATSQGSNEPTLIAWAANGGGYRVFYVHPSGVLGSPVTGLPSGATWADTITGPIAVAWDRTGGSRFAVAFTNTLPQVRWISNASLLTSSGIASVTGISGTWNRIAIEIEGALASGNTGAWFIAERDGARDDLNLVESGHCDHAGAMLLEPGDRQLRGHCLVSRAFYDDGNIYAVVGHAVQNFPYAAVVRISGDNFGGDDGTLCYARSATGEWSGASVRKHVASVHAIDPVDMVSRRHAVCIGYRLQLDSENGDQFGEEGIQLATLDFDAGAVQSLELGRGLYLASACTQHYDGRRWAELFHTAPDVATGGTIASLGAAGAIPDGTYLYKIVYEEVDAQGELHQGPPGVAITVEMTGGPKKVTLAIPTYRLTSKARVRIGVFRTEADAEGPISAIPFYRVTSLEPDGTGDNGYLVNDPTADTVSFTDNLTDAVLITREPLYTNGGILPNDPAPMRGDVLAGAKGRAFWTDPFDASVVRYSQEIDDRFALETGAELTLPKDPYGGDIVAIGAMDGAVYAFCETAIYGFGGPGPLKNPNAGAEAFSPMELVTADCGCKATGSICQSPVGIVFQSEKGIKLLDRGRQVQDIGAPVYAYNSQTITRATLLPDRSQIVFLTDEGTTLLWDYERNQWSTYTNHLGIDATVIDGVYYYLRTDGRVFRETIGQYADDNAHITMLIETAWIKMAGYLQGWQRILWAYFIGEWLSEHTLRVRYRIDYNLGYSAPIDLDVNTNYDPDLYGSGAYGSGPYGGAGGDTTRYQRAIHFNLPCQAISFLIQDSEETGDFGASFELSELLLIGGILDSRAKIGPARVQ